MISDTDPRLKKDKTVNLLVGSVTQVLIHILILVAGNTPVKGAVCENFYSKT